ncbi:hypothetical protein EUTSA_v10027450mg [Eutrema salsugineum]|uniref:Uncharacterized protein n=1 Tax=Eutrema salsugineum TaxID=72664 RepID=V4MGG0_EUTSA|nr:hypothetical protein EUTSA_v10027450mg [Eutrema salsugineum]
MFLFLKFHFVSGLDPTIREVWRKVSCKIVGMKETIDSISETKDENHWWSNYDFRWEEAMEEEMCRNRGGEEMERFCAQYLGLEN